MDPQQAPKTDIDRARRSLQIMQAALEKAKTTHGDLYTFGDCASVYAAMMNLNSFIDKNEPQQQQSKQVQQPPQQQLTQPFLTLNQPNNNHQPVVNYHTN